MDELLDLRGRIFLAGDLHANGIAQQAVGQTGDLGRHGGREQAGLALRRQSGDDAADVLDETQVEHPVGLIEDELGHRAEVQFAGLHQVADAARGADDDVGAAAHRLDLLEAAGAADDHHGAQTRQMDGQRANGLVDLQREFAGRGEDQGAGDEWRRPNRLGGEMLQDRQGEGGGLAAAGLGDAEQILAGQEWRDGIGLDRGGDGEFAHLEGAQKRLGDAEGGKSSLGQDVGMLQRPPRCGRKTPESSPPRAIKWGRTVVGWKFPEPRTARTAR